VLAPFGETQHPKQVQTHRVQGPRRPGRAQSKIVSLHLVSSGPRVGSLLGLLSEMQAARFRVDVRRYNTLAFSRRRRIRTIHWIGTKAGLMILNLTVRASRPMLLPVPPRGQGAADLLL
jgi:hypothetical protein